MTDSPFTDQAAMLALLNDLEAISHRPAETLSAWARTLDSAPPSPALIEFLTQLGAEWYRAPAPDALCEGIAAEVREQLAQHGVRGSHLWAHTQRVTGVALALSEESGDDPVLAFLAGILHDVTKLSESQGESAIPHEESGAAFAGDILRGDLPPDAVHAIQTAIRKESGSTLGDVLHDADKLDKIGAAGIVRRIAEQARSSDLRAALLRVNRDLDAFPALSFDASRTLARHKRDFLDTFLPFALTALDTPPSTP